MLDAAKQVTINRVVEGRYIAVVVRAVVKAVALAAVVGAVATVAEQVKESGMISIAWVVGVRTMIITVV
jgi:hypothetical protein